MVSITCCHHGGPGGTTWQDQGVSHRHEHEQTEQPFAPHTREFWDHRYGESQRVWSGNPNQRLVEQVAGLTPGTALDVGCGEGADAVWLASQGWATTGVDVSVVALERTVAHAAEAGVQVATAPYDVLAGEPLPGGPYDLVTSHFLHLPAELRHAAYAHMADAVAPGGRLLIVGHHPADHESGVRRPHGEGLMFTAAEVVGCFAADDWETEVAAEPRRVQQTPDGPLEVTDTVVRLRRR